MRPRENERRIQQTAPATFCQEHNVPNWDAPPPHKATLNPEISLIPETLCTAFTLLGGIGHVKHRSIRDP